jgi:hypothetical protein
MFSFFLNTNMALQSSSIINGNIHLSDAAEAYSIPSCRRIQIKDSIRTSHNVPQHQIGSLSDLEGKASLFIATNRSRGKNLTLQGYLCLSSEQEVACAG